MSHNEEERRLYLVRVPLLLEALVVHNISVVCAVDGHVLNRVILDSAVDEIHIARVSFLHHEHVDQTDEQRRSTVGSGVDEPEDLRGEDVDIDPFEDNLDAEIDEDTAEEEDLGDEDEDRIDDGTTVAEILYIKREGTD